MLHTPVASSSMAVPSSWYCAAFLCEGSLSLITDDAILLSQGVPTVFLQDQMTLKDYRQTPLADGSKISKSTSSSLSCNSLTILSKNVTVAMT